MIESDPNKYSKFNQLLSERQITSQEFLSELKNFKKSLFAFEIPHQQSSQGYSYAEQYGRLVDLNADVDKIWLGGEEKGDILTNAEDAVFKEIIGLQIESNNIQRQIVKERQCFQEINQQRQKIQSNPDLIFNDEIRRQENLLFKKEEIEQIKEQIEQISTKIQIINILDDNIDEKIENMRQKTQQIDAKKRQLMIKVDKRKFISQSKDKTTFSSYQSAQEEEQVNGQEIISMLKERLQIQARLQVQSDEKQEFIGLLMDFKEKYDDAMRKNIQLKSEHHSKNFKLPS